MLAILFYQRFVFNSFVLHSILLWVSVRRRYHILLMNYWANLGQIWHVASVG